MIGRGRSSMKDGIRSLIHRPSPAALMALVAMVFAVTGFAFAASIPDSKGVIHGCYKKKGGKLRVVSKSSKCKAKEKALDWNQKGPKGNKGNRGPSDGFSSKHDGAVNPPNAFGTITHLNLPAGKYVLSGKAEVDADGGEVVECQL